MKPKMPKPSNQLMIAAAASVLAMSAFALSAPMHGSGAGTGVSPIPSLASMGMPDLPSLPALLR